MHPFAPLLALSSLALMVVAVRPSTPLPTYRVAATDADAARLIAADDDPWSRAEAVSWGRAPYRTRFRAMHSPTGLWLRYDVEDAAPWHTLSRRDDHLWTEEVVEIFIDPDGDGYNYAEVEINPANVVCDLLVERATPELTARIEWDFEGMRSAVHELVDDPLAPGWTAVGYLPWDGFATLPETQVGLPPAAGDRWRFNAFRIKRPHGPQEPRRNVILDAWSPVPARSFHVPDAFGEMIFR